MKGMKISLPSKMLDISIIEKGMGDAIDAVMVEGKPFGWTS